MRAQVVNEFSALMFHITFPNENQKSFLTVVTH